MAESVKISELSELASQLLATDYVPIVRSGVTYKYAPYRYVVSATPLSDLSRVCQINGDGVPVFPDNVAGRTYWQDEWVTADSWDVLGGDSSTLSVSDGILKATATGTKSFCGMAKNVTGLSGKLVVLKVRSSTSGNFVVAYDQSGWQTVKTEVLTAGVWTFVSALIPSTATTSSLILYKTQNTGTLEIDTIYIGSGLYDTPVYDKACCNRATNYGVLPVKGPRGQALSFNGDQYLQFDNPVIGTTGTIAITFSLDTLGRDHVLVTNAISATGYPGITVIVNADNILRFWNGGTSAFQQVAIKIISDTAIHKLVVCMDSSNIYTSVDGGQFVVTPITVTPAQSTIPMTIGRNVSASGWTIGKIYDLRYDSRIWTQANVTRHHNGDDAVDSQQKSNSGTPHALAVYNANGFLGNTTPMLSLSAGVIGATSTVDVLSGGTLTIPSGSGYYAWIILTYGVTINSAATGYNSAGATVTGTASGNCRVLLIRLV